MNEEQLMRLQAWVDGELSEGEARRVERQLETDPEAQALVAELKMTKAFLADNEPEYVVPDTREFYWNQIKREIDRQAVATAKPDSTAETRPAWSLVWRRLLSPAAGLALVVFLAVFSLKVFNRDDSLQHLVEVENLDEHVGSFSYKSQSENMFVVWLYNKDAETSATDEEMTDDTVLQ